MKKVKPLLILLTLAVAAIAYGQEISLVADINTRLKFASVSNLVASEDRLFFTANDGIHGTALWTYDEILPPHIIFNSAELPDNPSFQEFALCADKLYFISKHSHYVNNSTYYDRDIWIYDGQNRAVTAESYYNLPFPDDPTDLEVFDDRLYFKAIDTVNHRKCLWIFDGTGAPAILEEKYKGFTGEGYLEIMAYFNNQLYLTAGLNEIWVYNGNDSLKKVVERKFYRNWDFIEQNGKLYFEATDLMNHGYQLWEFDGTNAPRIVSDTLVCQYNNFRQIIGVNNRVYYVYSGEKKLHEFNCNNEALNEFADVNDAYNLLVFENKLFFVAATDSGKYFLWEYDGIHPVKKHLGITWDDYEDYKIRIFVVNENLFAIPKQGELWLYDRDSGLFKKTGNFLKNYGTDHVVLKNKDYFVFSEDLWAFNGADFPARIDGINKCNGGSEPSGLFVENDTLYFQTKICSSCYPDQVCPSCCYAYDGVNPPRSGSDECNNTYNYFKRDRLTFEFDNILYYVGSCGRTLCSLVAANRDSAVGLLSCAYHSNFAAFNNLVYVAADDHLMCIKGMNKTTFAAGTQEIAFGSNPDNLLEFENRLIFTAEDSGNVLFLWAYDGSNIPEKVGKIRNPENFFVFNNKLYFSEGSELWELESQGHPRLVIQTCQGASCPTISKFMIFGDRLYFTASDGVHGEELWCLEEGKPPVMVSDIYQGTQGSAINNMKLYNNHLFFVANDGVHGPELWCLEEGKPPVMVSDIYQGTQGSAVHNMKIFNNHLLFVANDGVHGPELWKYNGVDQPVLLGDIFAGNTGSYPEALTIYKNKLYFSATDQLHDRELFVYCPYCSADTVSACETYISPSGRYIWDTSGTYSDTIPNAAGSDSIITINLTISHPSISTIIPTICNSYTSPSGRYTWTESGIYQDTIPNAFGCDSIIAVNLTVHKPSSGTLNEMACDTYASPSGKYSWTTSGTYTDTIPNAAGCDSIITIDLQIDHVDTTVIQDRSVLISNDRNASHQWIDCSNGNAPIEGETYLTFTPKKSGQYAVIVSQGACVDTSSCYAITVTGITELSDNNITLYPNPTSASFTIDLGRVCTEAVVTITSSDGQVIRRENARNTRNIELELVAAPGLYMVNIKTDKEETVFKLVMN